MLRAAIEVRFAFFLPDYEILLALRGSNVEAADCSSSESNELSIDFLSLYDGVIIRLSSTLSTSAVDCIYLGVISCA